VWIIKNKNRVRSEANYETDVLFTLLAGKCNVMHVWGSMSCVIDNEHLLKQHDKISSTSCWFNHSSIYNAQSNIKYLLEESFSERGIVELFFFYMRRNIESWKMANTFFLLSESKIYILAIF
jgi:hypothetical protein